MLQRIKANLKPVLSLAAVILVTSAFTGAVFLYLSQPVKVIPATAAVVSAVTAAIIAACLFLNKRPGYSKGAGPEEAGRKFADFMDDMPLGVFIRDDESRVIYLNRYMDRVFGKSNFLGKTPYNIYDRETADRMVEEDRRVLNGGSVMVEEVLTDKNGRERVYATHKFCLYDENGNRQVGGVSIEITRRREAEYKLRILSRAIRNSPVTVVITDPEGNIEYVNPAFVSSTGYSFAEVMGENMSIINSGKHDAPFFKELWTRIRNGGEWQGEILNKKKDGTLFWELVSISAVTNRNGEITHFVAIKDDISRRKQMEDALLRAKEKAEESDKLKSAFLANMSHEIRTPMNAIVGLSGLLGDPETALADRVMFSKLIRENSNVLLQLIDDIVDISKIEAGQITMRPEACNLTALMNEIYESFMPQVRERKDEIEFVIKMDEEQRELHTVTDQHRLRQIITNLLSNALKFTEKGKVEFGCDLKEGNVILFYVKDTGAGMPADKLNIIFDRFSQLDASTHGQQRGAGLGLSISKSLAELLGGSIWAESEEGKGSCFYLSVPWHPVEKTAAAEEPPAGFVSYPRLAGHTILVVEDLEVNYRLIEAMLKRTGAGILWGQTGEQALELFSGNPGLSLVLLDLNMPDIPGYDILVRFKKERQDLPVIIQTAYAMNGEKERCRAAGCDYYITKPIQAEQLLAAIQNCMLQET